LLGRAFELVGVCLGTAGSDALGGDLQAHDGDDPVFHDDHNGGFAIVVQAYTSGEPPTMARLASAGLNMPHTNFATATAPSNALVRAGTFPPPSPMETASLVSRRTSSSVWPLVAAARNSSTIRLNEAAPAASQRSSYAGWFPEAA
jgi:hypothetical protein